MPKDYEFAFKCFEKAAELGSATALFNLSTFYYEGILVEEDVGKALDLLIEAANKGEHNAVEALIFLFSGHGKIPRDDRALDYWIRQSL